MNRIIKIMAYIGVLMLFFMMLIMIIDIIGRFFFNRPVNGTWEIVGLMLVCAGTWCLSYCQQEKRHIQVTIILEQFSIRISKSIQGISYLIGCIGFSFLAWQALRLTSTYFFTKGYKTDTLQIPLYPFMFIMAIGNTVMAITLLTDSIKTTLEIRKP